MVAVFGVFVKLSVADLGVAHVEFIVEVAVQEGLVVEVDVEEAVDVTVPGLLSARTDGAVHHGQILITEEDGVVTH